MDSLGRIARHLPNSTISDPLERITIDGHGRVWVSEDTTLLVLKGHLIIEAELIDICGRLLKNPGALEAENVRFSVRLNLVRALLGSDHGMPEAFWHAIEDLNRIRNKLAHNLEPKGLEDSLRQFFNRFDEFEDCRAVLRIHEAESTPQRLKSCILFLSGALSGIGKSDDMQASEAGQ
jgi:uncharacterized protein YutE (UPF0331/DUF86 family)